VSGDLTLLCNDLSVNVLLYVDYLTALSGDLRLEIPYGLLG
jgi:hypothetical protein